MAASGPGTCPRCRLPVGADASCPHCGRPLTPLTWVATPPPSAAAPPPLRPSRYTGPPRYPFIPRWGALPLPWVAAEPAPAPSRDPVPAARSALSALVPLLWATATVALLAAGAETWRYVLLLQSRFDALPADAVAVSDALVAAAGTVAPMLAGGTGVVMVVWTLRAARAAARHAEVRPVRAPREIVLGWVIPLLNLAVPGSVLAEIEHAALLRPPAQRPRPSRLLLGWWLLWVADVLLAAVVALWSLRSGVQARADGVVLHAVLDLLAAVTAGITAVLAVRLTRLFTPHPTARREVLVAVR